ncbi:MAG: 4-hydroxythreonine-4-phosphate dehydrogenase PdxA [Flavobacteriia bacterium]|nr:MAG: 4-hydroxythreonine-4-phosphate dehydrogenase PdxA [Flavobacteriia bacterium]
MANKGKISVGISIGDLNGIGIEIILKTFEDKRILELCDPVLFASKKAISKYRSILKINTPVQTIKTVDQMISGKLNLINVWQEDVEITPGKANKTGGQYAFKSLEAAVQSLANDDIDFLLTAPINKETIQSEDFAFPGHTEYLGEQFEGQPLMILMQDNLRVALMTGHIPLDEVKKHITPELIEAKVSLLNETLKQDFSIQKPRIAVLSLNPHAGDHGVIGKEDDEILAPTLENIRKKGTLVYGPYPSDSFFGSGHYQSFDAILACYHDQGLTPFKTLAFGGGVNFTAGLSHLRVSPDHGTAFDIAGKGEADHSSFKQALYAGIDIFRRRTENRELKKNALVSKS